MARDPNYNPWLYCPHTCQHVDVTKSRLNNRELTYQFGNEVIIAGDIRVYNRATNKLPHHIAAKTAHPDCNANCPAYAALGKKHSVKDCLYEVSPEQMERWGLGIAILYMDTTLAHDVPEKFKRAYESYRNELVAAQDQRDASSSAEAGALSVSDDVLMQDNSTHPLVSSDILRRRESPTMCSTLATSNTDAATPYIPSISSSHLAPLFPSNITLDSSNLPLTAVWVEDPTRRQKFTAAKGNFVEASISPGLLLQFREAFPQQVYFLDEEKKQTQNPVKLPRGQPNCLVYENV